MKQPETTTSGVATLFPLANPARAGELLSACLHGVAALSHHLQRTPFSSRLQKLLESKFSGILKQLFGDDGEIPLLWRELPLRETRPVETGLRISPVSLDSAPTSGEARIPPGKDWMPLIKAAAPAAASPPAHCQDRDACTEKLSGCGDGFDLAGRCVLCVGGRAALYPDYHHIVETAGGSLLIYRSDQQGDADRLPTLLARADALVCPVDCINHEAYFAVKHYCKHSGKPCALLERSDLPTFRKGVEALAASTTSAPVIPFSNHQQARFVTN
ncbi:MAG: DUF2325 domain-containing protein [Nitrosomonadaceae bacterium]|nr:DUF2325 domain-containing protein [Nitrosomonadaceae bacterium]